MADANFLSFINPKLAAEQQKLQYQQALAQKLLEAGTVKEDDVNKLANPGGFVVPYSPFQGLEKVGKAAAGKYLQDKSLEDQSKLYAQMLNPQGSTPNPLGQQLVDPNAPIDASRVGQAQPPTQQTIMELAQAGTVTGNPQTDMMFMMQSPTDYMKSLASRNAPTDLFKNASNPVTQPYVAKDQYLKGGEDYFMPGQKNSKPPVSPQISSNPPAPVTIGGQLQAPANMDELLNSQTPPAVQGGAVNLTQNGVTNPDIPAYNPNSSAEIAGAKAAATKIGEGAITDVQKQKKGQEQITQVANNLNSLYDQLDKIGAASNTKKSSFENIAAYAGNSPVGQAVGQVKGTEAQSIRNQINQSLPTMINSIRQATGMSAKNMDSNTELQFYLKMATDPTVDIQTNKRAISNIVNIYGAPNSQNPAEIPPPQNIVDELRKRGVVK